MRSSDSSSVASTPCSSFSIAARKNALGLSKRQTLLNVPADFVLHSLRHTFATRLGESGADAFTIMRLRGHSRVTVFSGTCIRRRKRWNWHMSERPR